MGFSFEQAPVGLAHIAFDGQILQANPALGELLGSAAKDLVQLNYFAGLLYIADLNATHRAIQPLLKDAVKTVILKHRCLPVGARSKNLVRWVQLSLSLWRDSQNQPCHFIGVFQFLDQDQPILPQQAPIQKDSFLRLMPAHDALAEKKSRKTAAKQAQVEEALRQRNAEMEAIFEAFPDAFLRLTRDGKILDCRVQPASALFLDPDQWKGQSIYAFLPERVALLFEDAIAQAIHIQSPVSLEYSLTREQAKVFFEARLVPVKPQQVIGIIRDISDRKHIEEQLIYDALHDALTGLPNRVLFMDRLVMALRRLNRLSNHIFAVLFIDLDGFKLINDSLGHVVGDQLLIAIAELLQQCTRTGDTIARMGGDEFTVLVDGIRSLTEVSRVANRIQELLKEPILIQGNSIFAGASIGIVLGSASYTEAADLLRDADIALYQAKESGKGRCVIFDQEMYAATFSRQQLETHLRQALSQQQLCVYYQPIVELRSGKITGFEALVRWNHPQRGLISANEFVPVAEDTGMIVSIGLWVLRQACIQLRAWQSQFEEAKKIQITVNLSSKQLRDLDLADLIHQVLIETGIGGHQLKLELTESSLIDNEEAASEIWQTLRALNIEFSLDDFGTGYSSLSYLHKFPVSTVKIDQSFIQRMGPNQSNTEIIQAIVNLSKSLNLDVVAEGIETDLQLQQLQTLGCQFGQGYFFSRPLDQSAVTALLRQDEKFCVFPSDRAPIVSAPEL